MSIADESKVLFRGKFQHPRGRIFEANVVDYVTFTDLSTTCFFDEPVEVYKRQPPVDHIEVCLPEEHLEFWQSLRAKFGSTGVESYTPKGILRNILRAPKDISPERLLDVALG